MVTLICVILPISSSMAALLAGTKEERRRRFGLYFDILDHNVETDDFERLIAQVMRRLR